MSSTAGEGDSLELVKVDKLAFFIDMLPRLGIAKPELVQEVLELFNNLDVNNSGTLDKSDLEVLQRQQHGRLNRRKSRSKFDQRAVDVAEILMKYSTFLM